MVLTGSHNDGVNCKHCQKFGELHIESRIEKMCVTKIVQKVREHVGLLQDASVGIDLYAFVRDKGRNKNGTAGVSQKIFSSLLFIGLQALL